MKLPSVTEVLSVYQDFSNIPEATLGYATERGIAVHKTCAALAVGLWAPKLCPEWQGFVVSTRHWFDRMVEEVILVETQLKDEKFGFTGTLDYLLRLKDKPDLTVMDLKTPVLRYKVWAGQLAAYLRLAQVNGYDATDALTLQPDPKGGSAKAHYLEYGSEALTAFLAALTAYRYFKQSFASQEHREIQNSAKA
jgi:hypothetical protein